MTALIYVGGIVRHKSFFGLLALLLILPLGLLIVYSQDGVITTVDDNPALKITGINTSTLPDAVVTVNVVDTYGQYIPNLTVDDFILSGELADYARIVRVENVTDDNLPISVVLVIDTSSSMSGSPIARARQAATQFVDQLGENDSVAIITFDSDIHTIQDFTTDKALLREAIDTFPIGGQTALYDGTAVGLIYGATAPTERRTVVLLSDGAEYGWTGEDGTIHPASETPREEILRAVSIENVPIYTIGLGFGADRTYLQDLATTTNAQFYESPTPDSLTEIYTQIAGILRTQYILTLDAPLPNDGQEYDLGLQAQTSYGLTNLDATTLRAPIPVPIIQLPAFPLDDLTDAVSLPITILADDHPLDVQLAITQSPDGEVATVPYTWVEDGDVYTFSLEPRRLLYGGYQAQLTVTDANGDQATDVIDFSIGSIPSEFSVVGLPADNRIEGIFTADDTLPVSVDVAYSQKPVTRVSYQLNGLDLGETTEAPFINDIRVLAAFVGKTEEELSVTVYTEDRQDTLTIPLTLAVSPPPTPTMTPTHTPSLTPTPTPTFTPSPTPTLNIPATVEAQSPSIHSALGSLQSYSATQSAYVQETLIAESTAYAQATFNAQSTVDAQARFDARATANAEATQVFQATADAQATLDFEATNIAQQTQIFEATLSAELGATATYETNMIATETYIAQATTDAVNTADAQLLNETIATLDAQGTATAHAMLSTAQAAQTQSAERIIQVTADAQSTIDAVNEFFAVQTATREAQATLDGEATAVAVQTSDAESTAIGLTLEAQATLDAQNAVQTLDAESTVIGLTLEAQATLDAQNAIQTLDAESTAIGLTLEAQATADRESTAIGATLEAQATADAGATQTAEAVTPTLSATITPEFTNTPVVLIEVETPTSGTNFLTQIEPYLVFICGGGLFLLLILLLLFRRNKSK